MVVIALHNIAVQYEYLHQYQSAIHTYQKSYDYSRKNLGAAHAFTQKMEKVLQESTQKIKAIIEKQNKRLSSKVAGGPSQKSVPKASARSQPPVHVEPSLADILQAHDDTEKPSVKRTVG